MVCISSALTGQHRTILLMLGGRGTSGKTLNDSWMLDIEQNKWTQVKGCTLSPPMILRETYTCKVQLFLGFSLGVHCISSFPFNSIDTSE